MYTDGRLAWRKSSYTSNQMNCVEVAFAPSLVATRDSKNPNGPTLTFARGEWPTFLGRVKAGAFDPR